MCCYYSGASFLNKKLFCLEIDCGITSLMLEEMLTEKVNQRYSDICRCSENFPGNNRGGV